MKPLYWYEIIVTDPQGKVVYQGKEYSGHDASSEVLYLKKFYPECDVHYEYKKREKERDRRIGIIQGKGNTYVTKPVRKYYTYGN